MNKLILILALTMCGPLAAQELSADKQAEVEKLLEITGALAMAEQTKKQMIDIMAQSSNRIPQEVWQVIDEQLQVGQLQADLIEIYHQHFTLEEIKALNDFYVSKLGRRLLETQSSIITESMAAGQRWAQSVLPEIQRILKEKGYPNQDPGS